MADGKKKRSFQVKGKLRKAFTLALVGACAIGGGYGMHQLLEHNSFGLGDTASYAQAGTQFLQSRGYTNIHYTWSKAGKFDAVDPTTAEESTYHGRTLEFNAVSPAGKKVGRYMDCVQKDSIAGGALYGDQISCSKPYAYYY